MYLNYNSASNGSHTDLSLKVGTMVIIKGENTPPITWSLGRVSEVYPGSDGIICVVTIRTTRGLIKRMLSKICILLIEEQSTV